MIVFNHWKIGTSLGFLPPHDFGDVLAARLRSGPEARQAIRKDSASRCNPLLGPGLDGFACKSTNPIHLDVNGPAFVVELYGRDERDLVFRSATSLASTELATEVGIVNMDNSLSKY